MGKCPFQKNNPAFCPTSQNQLGKGPSFETRFSQNRVIKKKKKIMEPYCGVLRSL